MPAAELVPVLIALIGVGGTLGAQALSYRNSRRLDEARRKQENATRFHAERVRVYALMMAKSEELVTVHEPSTQLHLELSAIASQAELLASPTVRENASRVRVRAAKLAETEDAFNVTNLTAYLDAVDAFINAAREELGVEDGKVQQRSRLRLSRRAQPDKPDEVGSR